MIARSLNDGLKLEAVHLIDRSLVTLITLESAAVQSLANTLICKPIVMAIGIRDWRSISTTWLTPVHTTTKKAVVNPPGQDDGGGGDSISTVDSSDV